MNYLIIGAKGQLGRALADRLPEATLVDLDEADISDQEQVKRLFAEVKPDIVINAAAYTAVDKAEEDAKNCFLHNAAGSYYLAQACQSQGAVFVNFSTDFVFDGKKSEPYTENDISNPLSTYGYSKLFAELATRLSTKHYLVRTAWLFGDGRNFVQTMLKLSETKKEISVVADQIGSPTFTEDLAGALLKLVEAKVTYGIYHITNNGSCSWADLAEEIFRQARKKVVVKRITTKEFDAPASRPLYSVLSIQKLNKLGIQLPNWQDALTRYLKKL